MQVTIVTSLSEECHRCYEFIKKKMTHTQVWVKIKSYATIAPLSIFSLGKGREILTSQTLLNTVKKLNSVPSDLKPLRHTCLDPQCVCDTPQNCPTL